MAIALFLLLRPTLPFLSFPTYSHPFTCIANHTVSLGVKFLHFILSSFLPFFPTFLPYLPPFFRLLAKYLISANYPSASSRQTHPMRPAFVCVKRADRGGGGGCEIKMSQSRPLPTGPMRRCVLQYYADMVVVVVAVVAAARY